MNSWINPRQSALFSSHSFCGEESLARSKKEQASGNVLREAVARIKEAPLYRISRSCLESSSAFSPVLVASLVAKVQTHLADQKRSSTPEFGASLSHDQKQTLTAFWKSLSPEQRQQCCENGQWKWKIDNGMYGVVVAFSKGHLPAALAMMESFPQMSQTEGRALVNQSLEQGYIEGSYFLISKGLPWPEDHRLGLQDSIGRTLAWVAAREDDEAFMQALIDRGAPIDVADKYGWTPLLVAANAGHLDVVQALSTQEVNVGAMDAAGWMPLHRACLHGHGAVAKTLIVAMAAQADIPDYLGRTPLHRAVERNRVDIVRFLCQQCQVNPDQAGFVEGYGSPISCRQLAKDRKQLEICEIFDSYQFH
jgi:ankyrin repeat protein